MNYTRFEKHLESLKRTGYTEPKFDWHERLIDKAMDTFVKKGSFKDVLDVGFGTGYSMDKFKSIGVHAVGISLDQHEIAAANGHDVHLMDMAFLDFEDDSFDLVWCRHALEHSAMPVIALMEFKRVLRKCGYLYIELPSNHGVHLDNENHYSMFSDEAWQSLFRKVGLPLLYRGQYAGSVNSGGTRYTDIYWYYWLKNE
jgi:SAM-dependent methyltransferase